MPPRHDCAASPQPCPVGARDYCLSTLSQIGCIPNLKHHYPKSQLAAHEGNVLFVYERGFFLKHRFEKTCRAVQFHTPVQYSNVLYCTVLCCPVTIRLPSGQSQPRLSILDCKTKCAPCDYCAVINLLGRKKFISLPLFSSQLHYYRKLKQTTWTHNEQNVILD